jgi:hypothetical protein
VEKLLAKLEMLERELMGASFLPLCLLILQYAKPKGFASYRLRPINSRSHGVFGQQWMVKLPKDREINKPESFIGVV